MVIVVMVSLACLSPLFRRFMKKELLVIIFSCFLMSCSKTSAYFNNEVNAGTKSNKKVKYLCDRNTTLSVRFSSTTGEKKKNIAIINGFGDQAIILASQETDSGFLYSNGRYSLRGKGMQANWTVGRMSAFQCSMNNKLTTK